MSDLRRSFAARLLAVLVAGAVVRGLLIGLTPGEHWDLAAIAQVGSEMAHSPLHVYALNLGRPPYHGLTTYIWPYLPGFLPVTALLHWLSVELGIGVNRLDRVLMSCSDLALAWFLQWALGRLGRPQRDRLAAAALVALGPVFAAVSGVHGQLDSLAWLPAVAAVVLWGARRESWHVLACGVLIGIGIDIKTTPGLTLLALVPTVRDRRELALLLAGAAAVAAVSLAPFAIVSTRGLDAIVRYQGFPGRAGLATLLQPRLALNLLVPANVGFDGVTRFLLAFSDVILVPVLGTVLVLARARRLTPADTIVALLLALYVFAPAVLPQYWVWIVPFMILAGRLRAALAFQLALLPLLVAIYGFLQEPDQPDRHLSPGLVLNAYVPLLWIVSAGMLAGLALLLRRPRPVTAV